MSDFSKSRPSERIEEIHKSARVAVEIGAIALSDLRSVLALDQISEHLPQIYSYFREKRTTAHPDHKTGELMLIEAAATMLLSPYDSRLSYEKWFEVFNSRTATWYWILHAMGKTEDGTFFYGRYRLKKLPLFRDIECKKVLITGGEADPIVKLHDLDKHIRLLSIDCGFDIPLPKRLFHKEPVTKNNSTGRSFVYNGDVWQIHFDGDSTILKDIKGIQVLTYLLEKPGHIFTPVELTRLINQDGERDTSRDSKKEKIGTLREEGLSMEDLNIDEIPDPKDKQGLEESAFNVWGALKKNDTLENRNRWKETKDYLLKEYNISCIERDNNLSFKVRSKKSNQFTNARTNVQIRIKSAINNLEKKLPPLAKHLEGYIRTGNKVSYNPPHSETEWAIQR